MNCLQDAGIVGSNPNEDMDVWCVCMRLFCLRCPFLVSAIATADHSSKESNRLLKKNGYGTE
jgi:hypothetical protein